MDLFLHLTAMRLSQNIYQAKGFKVIKAFKSFALLYNSSIKNSKHRTKRSTKLLSKKMKIITAIILVSLVSCSTSQSEYQEYLEKQELLYDSRPDYWAQVDKMKLPKHYSIEQKLRIIAHGFDPHIRLNLAGILAEQEDHESIKQYLNSKDPAIAWAAAWTLRKCYGDTSGHSTYKRRDIINFETLYQK